MPQDDMTDPGTPTAADIETPSLAELRRRYNILCEIGRGGMGIVYKGIDTETDEVVAVKVLRPEIASDPDLIARFKNELKLARKITHKNVCRSFELMRFGSVVAITMEFVEGESLRAFLKRFGSVPVKRGLEWTQQICAVLAEAHGQSIIHRDLKPENILITSDGAVKVMDFGIARSAEGGATLSGALIGTPGYMSPEQLEGRPVDLRSDIYSMGIVLREMFGEAFVPNHLDGAIRKCLEKKPEKRFQNISELAAALENQREAPSVVGMPLPEIPSRLSSWRPWDTGILALAVLSFFITAVFRSNALELSGLRLEVDARRAQQLAEAVAFQLGQTLPQNVEAHLQYGETAEGMRIVPFQYGEGPAGRKASAGGKPLYWKVSFRLVGTVSLQELSRDRSALVSRTGRIREYVNEPGYTGPIPSYRPPSIEERRTLARSKVEQVCGPLGETLPPVETYGGESGAAYSAVWKPARPVGALPAAEVEMFAEKISRIKCGIPVATQSEPDPRVAGLIQGLTAVQLAALFLPLVFSFLFGQQYRQSRITKRLPVAVAAGFAATWTIGPNITFSKLSFPALIVGSLLMSLFFLGGLIAVERKLTLRWPGAVATWRHLFSTGFRERAVALGVLRGACFGFVILGVETLIALIFNIQPFISWKPVLEPHAVQQALGSSYPALFTAASTVFHGVAVALICGSVAGDIRKELQLYLSTASRVRKILVTTLALAVISGSVAFIFLLFGMHLPSIFVSIRGTAPIAAIVAILIATTFKFDLLTVTYAAMTAVFWGLALPLSFVFSRIGNSNEMVLMMMTWFVATAAIVIVSYRSEIIRELKRAHEP